ncbi:MAG: MarR family transcriptional regulator [Ponticaulis sp.]|nr:MarR family transcriptional regulator [Ponticaulis sp.]|tara:strand:- start:24147 stop:24593 length:447 start_codon:yes stop_codon:yes gene_type:complete
MSDDISDTFSVPIKEFPGYLLRAASQAAISRLSERLGEYDMRLTEASILVAIQTNPGCRQSQIGKSLYISSANLTPKLHQLEKRKLIKRKPLDGRTNWLTLTQRGDEVASACLIAMKEHEDVLLELIKPISADEFTAAMKRLTTAFNR